jgi:hypothetical protein
MPDISAVQYTPSGSIPTPYIIWGNKKAILVAGNFSDKEVRSTVTIPAEKIGIMPITKCFDLWNGRPIPIASNTLSRV